MEDVILEYPNTVVHTPLNLSVPFCNTNSKATDLKVTPFYFSIDFQLEAASRPDFETGNFPFDGEIPSL